MRSQIREVYNTRLRRYARADSHVARSAVVFAPHPDDETLGCGGTIIQRIRQGARVTIVVMTDGRVSHRHLIDAEELVAIRAGEVRAACATLGVAPEDVLLLGFEDGQLAEQRERALERVAAILRERTPDEVFIPHRDDFPADHYATQAIVRAAMARVESRAAIFEYPVWFWYHWPWVPLSASSPRESLRVLKRSLIAGLGLRLVYDCNYAVPIGDVLALKRAALTAHASQMSHLRPDPGWATLDDVGQGEFLRCFFGEYEPFRRTPAR